MTIVALIFTPLVLVYQGWSYWVFRARVRAPPQAVRRRRAPGGDADGDACRQREADPLADGRRSTAP